MSLLRWAFVCLLIGLCASARADQVEVTPGVTVTRKTYPVPLNEAPFFNFARRTAELNKSDEDFILEISRHEPDRAKAAQYAIARGWQALKSERDPATAAKRFNQAFLLDPQQSGVYHGLAAVVESRFRDFDFSDELFRIATRMNSPAPTLSADHGRMLLIAGRPAEAKPLLERGVGDNPDWAVPQSNLALALLQTGDAADACRVAAMVKGRDLDSVRSDLALLRRRANCP